MSAKLARLEQQEQEFMNKYGKKSQPSSQVCNDVTSLIHEDNPDATEKTKRKKSKRKEPSENDICDGQTTTDINEGSDVEDMKPKKNKDTKAFVNDDMMTEPRKKKKRNRKDKTTPEESFNGDWSSASHTSEEPHHESNETASCLPTLKGDMPKKEKKKRSVADISEDSTEKQPQELQEMCDKVSKKKRKKNQETSNCSHMENSTVMMKSEDTSTEEQNMDMHKKKRQRRKRR